MQKGETKMSISVSTLSFSAGVYLEICPYSRNRYSCHLSPTESRVVSDDLLQAAALVERGVGGHPQGLLWKSAFDSTRRVSSGWCVRVTTEQRTSKAWRAEHLSTFGSEATVRKSTEISRSLAQNAGSAPCL